MDSSSDESFGWTKASTGSDDSENIKNLSTNNDRLHSQEKVKKHHIKQEVDSSIDLKKQSNKNKTNHKNEPDDTMEVDSPRKKKIKVESGTHNDTVHRKETISSDDNQDNDYLNMLVKKEKEYEKPNKSKLKDEIINGSLDSHEVGTDTKNKDRNQMKQLKKKKKSSKHCNDNDNLFLNGDINYRDDTNKTEIEESIRNKSNSSEDIESFVNGESNQREDTNETKIKESKKKKKKANKFCEQSEHEKYNENLNSDNNKSITVNKNIENVGSHNYDSGNFNDSLNLQETGSNQMTKTSSQRVSRLSDRIKFEDEMESDIHSDSFIMPSNNIVPISCNLRRFLKDNNTLKTISSSSNINLNVNDDDELWILKCPHDFDINKLKNSNFNLDNKSKIKINGESYSGNMVENPNINIMFSNKNEFKITNVAPNGIIHFRKRLPKPHVHDDNVMVNNQTDFIPLPETKCRHPLFGPNYKDYINIPTKHIKPPSNAFNTSSNKSDRKKKKKHKMERNETEIRPKIENDLEPPNNKPFKMELDAGLLEKKSKKRKHNHIEDTGKKSKRRKLEPASDAWDSEKAIEENLFNF